MQYLLSSLGRLSLPTERNTSMQYVIRSLYKNEARCRISGARNSLGSCNIKDSFLIIKELVRSGNKKLDI